MTLFGCCLRVESDLPSPYRPLPSPATPSPNAIEGPRPLPNPRLPSHPLKGAYASPVAYARDRQRSLPQPTPTAMRNMPSMLALRYQAPITTSAIPPDPSLDLAYSPHGEEQSSARQASTPKLESGSSRLLPRPPLVPQRDNLASSSADATILPVVLVSPTFPAPGSASNSLPFVAGMDRSDTVSSIKSLDRWEMSRRALSLKHEPESQTASRRPLPTPQVSAAKPALAPSRSLDRGTPGHRGTWGTSGAGISTQLHLQVAKEAESEQVEDVKNGRQTDVEDTTVATMHAESGPPTIVLSHSPQIPRLVVAFDPFTSPSTESGTHSETLVGSRERQNPDIVVDESSVPSISISTDVQSAPRTPIRSVPYTDPSHPGPGILCAACNLVILGTTINAAGKRLHPDCLRCATCGVGLEHVSRYDHDGMPYCHMDYHEVSHFTMNAILY